MSRTADIITDFERQVSDVTELSSAEELSLLNRVYNKVCTSRPWEILKTSVDGALSGSGVDGMYITLPSDFAFFYENAQYTDNSEYSYATADRKVIYIGGNPYKIVNYGDRRKYLGSTGYCYLDLGANKVYFTGTPESSSYSMDYIKFPPAITASVAPIFPASYDDLFTYAMAFENEILELSPKATSYAQENRGLYNERLADLQYWNSNLISL